MTEQSPSKELTVGPAEGELSADAKAPTGDASMSVGQASFAYRAAVMTVRGSLQLVIMVMVLVGSSFLMNELVASRKERPARVQKEAVYTIETVMAKRQDNRPMISVFGDVVAGRMLNLTALVAGEVVDVNPALRAGARVSRGDTLLQINKFAYEIARDEAKANLSEAEAVLIEARARLAMEETGLKRTEEQLRLAEADLERARDLVRTNTVTQRVVEERELVVSQRKAAFQTSGANIAIQKAQIEARAAAVERFKVVLRNAEQAVVNTTLKAPFDAIVQEVNVEIGQTVATSLSLVTLYEADTLDARFVLSDGQYGRLIGGGNNLQGRAATVNWKVGSTENPFPAKIDRIGAEIAANRGGVQVFARIGAEGAAGGLRPGAFVTVDVPDRLFENTVRLPETAIFEGNVAYVVGPQNRLMARPVKIAVYDGEYVIVADGLKDGEEVLITQIAEVGEGLLVRHAGDKESNLEPSQSSEKAPPQDKSAQAARTKPQG